MRRIVVGLGIVVLVASALVPNAGAAQPVRDGWKLGTTAIVKSPLGERRNLAIAVHGSRVYAVGGVQQGDRGAERTKRDGAVLDLRTKRWKHLPDLPFRRTLTSGAIAAGRKVVVTGVTCPGDVGDEHGCSGGRLVAAAYSPGASDWRQLRVPRRLVRGFGGGMRPLVASRTDVVFAIPGVSTVAVDLGSGRWRELPPQLGWTNEPTCAIRGYAAFLGGAPPGSPNALRLVRPTSKRWSGPHVIDDGGRGVGQPACTRDNVVATTFPRQAACTNPCIQPRPLSAFSRVQRFDLSTLRWSDLAPPPPPTGLSYYATGHGSYVDYLGPDGGPGLRLAPGTGAWSPIASGPSLVGPLTAILWTRGLAVIQDGGQLLVYRPV